LFLYVTVYYNEIDCCRLSVFLYSIKLHKLKYIVC